MEPPTLGVADIVLTTEWAVLKFLGFPMNSIQIKSRRIPVSGSLAIIAQIVKLEKVSLFLWNIKVRIQKSW